jgi:hypothetical protein
VQREAPRDREERRREAAHLGAGVGEVDVQVADRAALELAREPQRLDPPEEAPEDSARAARPPLEGPRERTQQPERLRPERPRQRSGERERRRREDRAGRGALRAVLGIQELGVGRPADREGVDRDAAPAQLLHLAPDEAVRQRRIAADEPGVAHAQLPRATRGWRRSSSRANERAPSPDWFGSASTLTRASSKGASGGRFEPGRVVTAAA